MTESISIVSNLQHKVTEMLDKTLQKDPKINQRMKLHYNQFIKNQNTSENKENEEYHVKIKNVERLGSLSNQVYRVQMQNGSILIIKKYLGVLKEFVERELEHKLIEQMCKKNEYPKVFYHDSNMRIEDYIKGSSIQRKDLNPILLKTIVQRLAYFSINYQSQLTNFIGNKNRQISNLFYSFLSIYEDKKFKNPKIMEQVEEYVQKVLKDEKILQNLQKLLQSQHMILNHNDSNLSNILVLNNTLTTQKIEIQLLDFQFSNLNYLGFDLGNLLNEIATDYGGAYENGQHASGLKFQIRQDWQIQNSLVKKLSQIYYDILEQKSGQKSTQSQRLKGLKIGRMLSHLYWLFIGLKQIDDPNIDLDMVYYVKRRYQEFMKLYEELI